MRSTSVPRRFRFFQVAAALALSACASAPPERGESKFSEPRNVVLVLGTIHFAHMEHPQYHLGHLAAVMAAFDPTDLAVEISPSALAAGDLLEGPLEMAFLVDLAAKQGVRVIGIDWLPPDAWWLQPEPEFDGAAWQREIDEITRARGPVPWPPSLFEANGAAFSDRARALHKANVRHKSDLGDMDWTRRNLWMTHHLERLLERPGERRVLVAVGTEHKYFFEDMLRLRPDSRLVQVDSLRPRLPPRPRNDPVSDTTLELWRDGGRMIERRIAVMDEAHPLRARLGRKLAKLRDAIARRGVAVPP